MIASIRFCRALALTAVVGCADRIVDPSAPMTTAPLNAVVADDGGCPLAPTVVVSNETDLRRALADAHPGDVIAIHGMIQLTGDLIVATDGITVTCKSTGSGLFSSAGDQVNLLVNVQAHNVAIDRLVLDARNTIVDEFGNAGPYQAAAVEETGLVGARLTNNRVFCGAMCAFFVGVRRAHIANNDFQADGAFTGVHVQGRGPQDAAGQSLFPTDETRIQNNIVVTTKPSAAPNFGGIRPFNGKRLVISGNQVGGPWVNSISLGQVHESVVAQNTLDGPVQNGIALGLPVNLNFARLRLVKNLVTGNRVRGAGQTGVRVQSACFNTFVLNDLRGNANNSAAIFEPHTGANVFLGTDGLVTDRGSFDCDADGDVDPNVIRNTGGLQRSASVGLPAASMRAGIIGEEPRAIGVPR
jgi:hypothetical protein